MWYGAVISWGTTMRSSSLSLQETPARTSCTASPSWALARNLTPLWGNTTHWILQCINLPCPHWRPLREHRALPYLFCKYIYVNSIQETQNERNQFPPSGMESNKMLFRNEGLNPQITIFVGHMEHIWVIEIISVLFRNLSSWHVFEMTMCLVKGVFMKDSTISTFFLILFTV